MPKVEYIPIIFNLVSCGLVQITDQAPQQNRLATLKSLGIDEAAVQGVLKNLLRPETGILTYPAFIYLLDQEYLRYEYFNTPFSLLVFSIGQRKQEGNVEALQMLAVRRAMQRISLVKRQIDMLGHYETFDYAMILPSTNSTAASALANRIADVLREAPLSSDMDSRSLALAFGVATVPEDCQELDKVLLAARKARDKAKFTQQRVCLAREIINQPGGLAAPT
jgi:GGDEF domain-containing protein